MFLLYLIPKNWLSRMVGRIVRASMPGPLRRLFIRGFAQYYRINVAEAEFPIEGYASIGAFFTRRLAEPARPIGEEGLLHPADSVITEAGRIREGQLVQAKEQFYTLEKFLAKASSAATYQDGAFATYYLCPTDYHRVHSPVDGFVKRVSHIPGNLWPVNSWSVNHIQDLFVVNERVVVEIESAYGMIAVVFVGATNVGEISLSFWPEFRSNAAAARTPRERMYGRELMISKGDELGIFHMGSTIVLLLSREVLNNNPAILPAVERLKGRRVKVRSNMTVSQPVSPAVSQSGAHP